MSTAIERVTKYVHTNFCSAPLNGWDDAAVAGEIIALARPRVLMALLDYSKRTGVQRTTLQSWIKRGQHEMPVPISTTSAGQIWDAEDIEKWCEDHPELLR